MQGGENTLFFPVTVTVKGQFAPDLDPTEHKETLRRTYGDKKYEVKDEIQRLEEEFETLLGRPNIRVLYKSRVIYKFDLSQLPKFKIHNVGDIVVTDATSPFSAEDIAQIKAALPSELQTVSRYLTDHDDEFREIDLSTFPANEGYRNFFAGNATITVTLGDIRETKNNIRTRTMKRTLQGMSALPQWVTNYSITPYLGQEMSANSNRRARPIAAALSKATLNRPFEERLAEAEAARPAASPAAVAVPAVAEAAPVKKPWYRFWGGRRATRKVRTSRKAYHMSRKGKTYKKRA